MELRTWIGCLIAAVLLALFVSLVKPETAEIHLIEAIQDTPFSAGEAGNLVRAVTTTEADVAVGAALALILWLTGHQREALITMALLVTLPLAQHGIKLAVDRERPPFEPDELWSQPTSSSFPSGHVMSATVIYGWVLFLTLRYSHNQVLRTVVTIVASFALLTTGLTSAYLAVHWPTDALGGYLWGLVLLLPAISFTLGSAFELGRARVARNDKP